MAVYNFVFSCLISAVICCLAVLPVQAGGDFALHTSAGTSWQNWSSGLSNAPVKVETESLRALRLEGRVSWRGRTLLRLAHSRSLGNSSVQDEMLAASGDQGNSLQETLGVLDLLAWVAGEEEVRNDDVSFLHRLLGLRVSYTHNLYYGDTASHTSFTYLDFSGWENSVVFEDGEQLAFRTLFRDLRIMTPVYYDRFYAGAVVRVGYFRSRWEKVAPAREITLDGNPLVQDTRRDIGGLTISYDNSLDLPGVGWGVSMDVGLLGTGLTTPESFDTDTDYGPTYSAIRGELRWNLGRDDGRSGLTTSLGGVVEWRSWQENGSPLDRDLLTRIFGRVGFDFVL